MGINTLWILGVFAICFAVGLLIFAVGTFGIIAVAYHQGKSQLDKAQGENLTNSLQM